MAHAVLALALFGATSPRQPQLHLRIVGVAPLLQLLVVGFAQDLERLDVAIRQLGDRIKVAGGRLGDRTHGVAALALRPRLREDAVEHLLVDVVLERDERSFAARARPDRFPLQRFRVTGINKTNINNLFLIRLKWPFLTRRRRPFGIRRTR